MIKLEMNPLMCYTYSLVFSLSVEATYATLPRTTRGIPIVLGGDPKGKNFLYTNGTSVIIRNIEVRIINIYLGGCKIFSHPVKLLFNDLFNIYSAFSLAEEFLFKYFCSASLRHCKCGTGGTLFCNKFRS